MEKQKQMTPQPPKKQAPQIKVRSNVSAGGSLENCQDNLAYWQKIYNQRCLYQ
jgi:hypothetical protein